MVPVVLRSTIFAYWLPKRFCGSQLLYSLIFISDKWVWMSCHLNSEGYVRRGRSWRESMEKASEQFQSRWCVAIMSTRTCKRCFPSLQNSRLLKLSHALLFALLSQPLYVRELCVRLPLLIEVFAVHSACTSPPPLWQTLRKVVASAPWGSGRFWSALTRLK